MNFTLRQKINILKEITKKPVPENGRKSVGQELIIIDRRKYL